MSDIKLWLKDDNILYQFQAFLLNNIDLSNLLPAIALYLTQENWKCFHIRNRQATKFHIPSF